MIKTDNNGYIPIENIKSGERVNGEKVINVFSSVSNKKIVKISKNSFGLNKPNKDLFVTEDHLVLNSNTDRLSFAKHLVNNKSISFCNSNKNNEVYHILFKKWVLVNANNLKCESVCPLNKKSLLYMKKNNKLTEKEYSQLIKKNNKFNYKNVYHVNNLIFC